MKILSRSFLVEGKNHGLDYNIYVRFGFAFAFVCFHVLPLFFIFFAYILFMHYLRTVHETHNHFI